MREPRKPMIGKTKIEIADIIISLIALSRVDRFTTNRQVISGALMRSLSKISGIFPKLDFQRVKGKAVYCDALEETLNLLLYCGMLGLENPEFRYLRVLPLMSRHYETSVKHKFSAQQIEELKHIAQSVFRVLSQEENVTS